MGAETTASPYRTTREAAAYARCSVKTVLRAIDAGALEAIDGWTKLIHRDALITWVETGRPPRPLNSDADSRVAS